MLEKSLNTRVINTLMAQVQVQDQMQQNNARRIIFLNALPLNAFPRRYIRLDVLPISIQELVWWINRRLAEGYRLDHYIRHASTIQALRAVGIPLADQPNPGVYRHEPNDILVVVALRNPVRGQEVYEIRPDDLEVWVVTAL